MVQARGQHPNAVLTPEGRRRMVGCVLDRAWTVEATAERFQVDAKTVRKWRDRYLREGVAGLRDRSSRPHSSPKQTPRSCQRRVVRLRRRRRWGAARIGAEVGIATSTAQSILNRAGLGRLDRGDRATDRVKPRRYQRDRPGELVHVDVKKLSRIPAGGGWRAHGRGQVAKPRRVRPGYAYIHTAIDDRTRLAYSEILHDEQGATAAMFWMRAMVFFIGHGLSVERVLTDNGSCYRSRAWAQVCRDSQVTHKRTRPYRPQTNGKVERFHRILLEEWAYIRNWTSETQRHAAYSRFIHFYNHHRPHGSLGWHTPHATLTQCLGDNLSGQHS
jgi:transposase InsO family protein